MPEGPQITLDVLYEYLLNEMRNEPLPENPQADAALLEFERNLKVPEQEANTLYAPTEHVSPEAMSLSVRGRRSLDQRCTGRECAKLLHLLLSR